MVQSKILSKYPEIIHFFGDKKDYNAAAKLGIKREDIILAEQIHGNKVVILKNGKNKFIHGTDGMVTDKQVILGIRTADCLPIFFYDPRNKIIAAIHAGWKGLLKGIIKNAIAGMRKLGSSPWNLNVSVGPHIQVCCYDVPKARMKKFKDKFFYVQRLKECDLDLSKIALLQLQLLDIKNSNIEISDICTSCNFRFWSFRRDKQKSGRMVNIIGLLKN